MGMRGIGEAAKDPCTSLTTVTKDRFSCQEKLSHVVASWIIREEISSWKTMSELAGDNGTMARRVHDLYVNVSLSMTPRGVSRLQARSSGLPAARRERKMPRTGICGMMRLD